MPVLVAALFLLPISTRAGDFIRISEDAAHAQLQTAITRYEKDGTAVDLIGAIHIADKAYYEQLNQRFTHYDVLLFEMIGGENIAARLTEKAQKPAAPGQANPQKLDTLRQLYSSACDLLHLTGQTDGIDYSAKNFVHADLTYDQFQSLQTERRESILSFFLISGIKAKTPEKQPNSIRMMRGLLTKNPDLLKREIMITMDSGEDQIAAFAGESVIISDRNARCIEVLKTQLATHRRRIGIFYGAAHFPDMEKRLLELGFQRKEQEWLTAWEVAK